MRVGVDEAGKGPVIGSMMVAAVRAAPDALPPVADSKAVPADRRESLARRVRDVAETAVVAVTPALIDHDRTAMTGLTAAAHAAAGASVAHDGDRVLCDAADTDADRFAECVAAAEPDRLDAVSVDAAHRADETDPLVSAASLVAKVERDAHVDRLASRYGEVGSGYPSDATTRAFLQDWIADHDSLPDIVRHSWQTSQDLLAAAEQSDLDRFVERSN